MHPLLHLKLGRVAREVSLAHCAFLQQDILYFNLNLSVLTKNKGHFLKSIFRLRMFWNSECAGKAGCKRIMKAAETGMIEMRLAQACRWEMTTVETVVLEWALVYQSNIFKTSYNDTCT